MNQHAPFLMAAREAAAAARDVILRHYDAGVAVEFKGDDSPVTRADLEAESAIVNLLKDRFPDHGFYGEELGQQDIESDYVWLIDPIDGTKSFVRRCPFFSTQIALMHAGEIIVGVSCAPVTGEVFHASRGGGAWNGTTRLEVQTSQSLERAVLSTGNLNTLIAAPERWSALGSLMQSVHRHRGYGDFLHYHLLAQGSVDLIVESDVNILDIAALSVIVEEAGGVFTDLEGGALSLETTSVLAAGAPSLYQHVKQTLRS